jgi:hypothetical protein
MRRPNRGELRSVRVVRLFGRRLRRGGPVGPVPSEREREQFRLLEPGLWLRRQALCQCRGSALLWGRHDGLDIMRSERRRGPRVALRCGCQLPDGLHMLRRGRRKRKPAKVHARHDCGMPDDALIETPFMAEPLAETTRAPHDVMTP